MIFTYKLNHKFVTCATIFTALACAPYISINASGISLCPILHFEKSLLLSFIKGSAEEVPPLWDEKFFCYTRDHAPKKIVIYQLKIVLNTREALKRTSPYPPLQPRFFQRIQMSTMHVSLGFEIERSNYTFSCNKQIKALRSSVRACGTNASSWKFKVSNRWFFKTSAVTTIIVSGLFATHSVHLDIVPFKHTELLIDGFLAAWFFKWPSDYTTLVGVANWELSHLFYL